jgi:hypothetical protein
MLQWRLVHHLTDCRGGLGLRCGRVNITLPLPPIGFRKTLDGAVLFPARSRVDLQVKSP